MWFVERGAEWVDPVVSLQLVIWNVEAGAGPGIAEAFVRLDHLRANGPDAFAYGWAD